MTIEFIDLKAQQNLLSDQLNKGIQNVLAHGKYVMGPEVKQFEKELANFGNAKHALGCANGTDALMLALMAWNIGPGRAVFCPSFTYCATAEVIAVLGATPVFVDVDRDTYNLDVESLKQAIADVRRQGELIPRADYPKIQGVAKSENLKLISDSAQGFGSTLNGKHPLYWADLTTTSFFPAKPLGCYGDGGAILTNDDADRDLLDSLRIHGKGEDKYDNVRIGLNSRLDTLQAAILLPKLAVFAKEIEARNRVANRYIEGLNGHVLRVPHILDGVISTWAQFTIEVNNLLSFAEKMKEKGIPTARYYPKPVHTQKAYRHFPCAGNGLPHTEDCMDTIISLPMHPYLDEDTQDMIIEVAKSAIS